MGNVSCERPGGVALGGVNQGHPPRSRLLEDDDDTLQTIFPSFTSGRRKRRGRVQGGVRPGGPRNRQGPIPRQSESLARSAAGTM